MKSQKLYKLLKQKGLFRQVQRFRIPDPDQAPDPQHWWHRRGGGAHYTKSCSLVTEKSAQFFSDHDKRFEAF